MPGQVLKLGDVVPNFSSGKKFFTHRLIEVVTLSSLSDTTQGNIDFHSWIQVKLLSKLIT